MSVFPNLDAQLVADKGEILAAIHAHHHSVMGAIRRTNERLQHMAKTLDDILAAQATALAAIQADDDLDNAIAGIVTSQKQTITDLKAQLDAAIASGDPAKVQAVSDNMDAINARLDAQKIAAAATAGTT